VKEGDETHTIEVRATATNDNGVTISGRCQVKQPQREIEQGLTLGYLENLCLGYNPSWCPKRKLDKALEPAVARLNLGA
jgi:hypothetical protein